MPTDPTNDEVVRGRCPLGQTTLASRLVAHRCTNGRCTPLGFDVLFPSTRLVIVVVVPLFVAFLVTFSHVRFTVSRTFAVSEKPSCQRQEVEVVAIGPFAFMVDVSESLTCPRPPASGRTTTQGTPVSLRDRPRRCGGRQRRIRLDPVTDAVVVEVVFCRPCQEVCR